MLTGAPSSLAAGTLIAVLLSAPKLVSFNPAVMGLCRVVVAPTFAVWRNQHPLLDLSYLLVVSHKSSSLPSSSTYLPSGIGGRGMKCFSVCFYLNKLPGEACFGGGGGNLALCSLLVSCIGKWLAYVF